MPPRPGPFARSGGGPHDVGGLLPDLLPGGSRPEPPVLPGGQHPLPPAPRPGTPRRALRRPWRSRRRALPRLEPVTAFLAWFGGTGYLMSHYYGVWLLLGLGVASASGLAGAAAIFWFVAKVLVSAEENLDPADYEMVGVLGRITNPIRPGGTGELVYSQEGTRRTTGARSEDGIAIAKGIDVVVTRYEKGIAYVRPWESITGPGEETDHDR